MDLSDVNEDFGGGSGTALPIKLLALCTISTLLSTIISLVGIRTHLRNYRMPLLQRFTVRILLIVPIYSLASLISIFSLDAAYWIDVGRDLYEAFVIYCFFNLLVSCENRVFVSLLTSMILMTLIWPYRGGERQLMISLHGRNPTKHMLPVSLFQDSMDVSDPHSFLFLKRGILQYAWIKPLLALLTLVLKLSHKYEDGVIAWNTGYTYVQLIYNISICTALYCLGLFWLTVNKDLEQFRPIPKFLCVKGILFATFWQGLSISFLVAIGVIKTLGPYTDAEHISIAIGDILICFEMPLFAMLHMYAFSYKDYITAKSITSGARMPLSNAFKDAFSMKDVWIDSIDTLNGEGFDYKTFEPNYATHGRLHKGKARDNRFKAGLRYAHGGSRKYWINDHNYIRTYDSISGSNSDIDHDDLMNIEFKLFDDEELLYYEAKKLVYGDYNYPNIDVRQEEYKRIMRIRENELLSNKSSAASRLTKGSSKVINKQRQSSQQQVKQKKSLNNVENEIDNQNYEDDYESNSYSSNDDNNNNGIPKVTVNDYSFSYQEPNPWS